MANLNKVMLIGNLTRDPELRVTPKGTAICQFSLAVNRKFKDESGGEREEVTTSTSRLGVSRVRPLLNIAPKGALFL